MSGPRFDVTGIGNAIVDIRPQTEIRDELKSARDDVTRFTLENRAFRDSPNLLQRYNELVAEERGIRVTVAEGDATVIADRSRLRQVFANLD